MDVTQQPQLDISYNYITHLPAGLGRLTALETLRLKGNPLVFPPESVVRKGTRAILDFLRKSPA
jgi:hypothetical protein